MRETDQGIVFGVFVQPRASRTRVAGLRGDALKVSVTAPPAEGEANRMLTQYLAKALGLPKSSIEIVSGHGARSKQVLARWPASTRDPEARAHLRKRIEALFAQE